MDIFKSTYKIGAAKIGNSILNLIGIIYFARTIGSSGLGIFFLFQASANIGALISDLGIQGAVEKRISEQSHPGEILASGIALKTIFISLLSIPIFMLQSEINNYVGSQVSLLLVVAIGAQGFATLFIKVMNAELRVGETAIIRFGQQVIWILLSVIFLWAGFGVNSLIYGLIIGLVASTFWGLYEIHTELKYPTWSSVGSIFDYSKYNFIASASWRVHNWADVAILGVFMSSSFVGAYEIAWRVTVFVSLAITAITTTIFPQISAWQATGDRAKIESIVPDILAWSLLIVIPAFFGSLVLSEEILHLVFGEEFIIAALVLIILMSEKIIEAVYRPLKRVLEGMDFVSLAAKMTIVGVVTNIGLNIILIQRFGIEGAAIATSASVIVMTVMVFRYTSRYITIEFPYQKMGWMIVSSVGMALIIMGIKFLIQPLTLPSLLLIISTGVFVYFVTLILSTELRSDMRRFTKQIIE